MLKIERRSRELYVLLQTTKHQLFSRPFLLALVIALTIHLSALLLFRFPLFRPNYSPPNHMLVVQTAPLDGQLIANALPEAGLVPDYLMPKPSLPQTQFNIKTQRSLPQATILSDLFSAIEEPLIHPILNLPEAALPPRIYISGPLAEYETNSEAVMALVKTMRLGQRVQVAVEVDALNGKIHWYEPLTEVEDVLSLETLLQSLTFSIPNRVALVPGEIEVVPND